MPEDFDIMDLEPGDCLLYRPSPLRAGFWSWLAGRIIALKTWHWVAHVEIYGGNGWSFAARNTGVSFYEFRRAGLVAVLRPPQDLKLVAARAWFATVDGQKYDWLGLLCFTLAVLQGAPDRMFCSEFATRYYRAAGVPIFGREDADKIAPAQFLTTEDLTPVWPLTEPV